MLLCKFDRLRYACAVISALIAVSQAYAAASDETTASPAETASSLQVITLEDSAEKGAEPSAVSADEATEKPASPTDQTSDEPAAPADQTAQEQTVSPEETLKPIPDPQQSGLVPVKAASFNGITPGASTLSELQEAWGPPREIANRNAQLVHLYRVEPFDRVEVTFNKERVAAIVIRLDRAFSAKDVAEQLKLSDIRPVLVSNELGQVLGQSYPERGVLFAFESNDTPGTASMQVVQIMLEPVSADAFVLRAETNMESQPESSLHDLDQAIKLAPKHPRAYWLRARVLAAAGDSQAALEASSQAVGLEPYDPQYRLTRAQILGQLGRFADAIEEAQRCRADSTKRPHIKARALCLLGDLSSSQAKPDYRKAMEFHMEAIKTADPLAVSRHPAIRLAAKEVLVDAHLGAAHDIAWGPWNQKDKAVPRWLEQAAAVAKDLVESEGGSVEHQFRVATRALAACVGMRGQLDPSPWIEEALRVGQELIAAAPDPTRQQQIRWDLGMALYDVVQICQMRGDHEAAILYGKRAVGYLEPAAASEQASLSETYLLGRLYFRLGAIHAVGKNDHAGAILWFEKAVPVFEKTAGELAQTELGRLGETFVSMGVSFWEKDDRERAVQLTQRGVELMEQAVKAGDLEGSALEVPYGNLATMARQLGKTEQADKYFQEAKKYKKSATR